MKFSHNDGGFWADRCYWAPECYYYKGSFYLVASFRSAVQNLGTQIIIADSPTGPFHPHSDGPVTPKDWNCLDGTLYFSGSGTPYMIFSHSFEDNPNGEMHAIELTGVLRAAVGEPKLLFEASTAPWSFLFRSQKRNSESKGMFILLMALACTGQIQGSC